MFNKIWLPYNVVLGIKFANYYSIKPSYFLSVLSLLKRTLSEKNYDYLQLNTQSMIRKTKNHLKEGDQCKVTGGTHAGKSGTVRDVNTSKTGHITITVEQKNEVRFKTLGKNVVVLTSGTE